MIVCQCKGISDEVIRGAIREGATTVYKVGVACSAGTDCGGCRPIIEQLIQIELAPTRPNMVPERRRVVVAPAFDVHS